MSLQSWIQPPRHLLVLFFGITTISAATLGWLSWQLVRQDRALAVQRAQEQRENAADSAVVALQKQLSQMEEEIASADDGRPQNPEEYSRGLPDDAILLVFNAVDAADAVGFRAYPKGHLLYYPASIAAEDPPSNQFMAADAFEFLQKDYAGAIDALAAAARSSDRRTKAEAIVRLARNLRNAERAPDAMKAYEELSRIEDVYVQGIPAELIARGAICDLLSEHEEDGRLQREASTLLKDLQSGRWRLTRSVYDVYSEQARRFAGEQAKGITAEHVAITEAAQSLWTEWTDRQSIEGRQTLWVADQPVLAISRRTTSRTAALLIGPSRLAAWFKEIEQSAAERNSRIVLTDAKEHPIAGRIQEPLGSYSVRLSSATGLPWTVYAASLNQASGAASFSFRSRLVMAGLFAIAFLVLGGCYLIGRAVARELAVAKLQSDFVTAVSHEFRTPLTAMRQLSELLSKGRVINDAVRQQYYEVLEHETARLHRLVEGLLKFGRMEAGAVRYQFEAVDMGALLRSLVEEFTPVADRRGYHIQLNVEPAIPSVQADREALGCVIWNLLDNAVKYSPGRDKVWLALSRENGNVAIRVRDEGVGIAREDQQRVFKKFVRAEDALKLGVQGAGIGLAVVHQIVATHSGEIKLESKPGAGSTFTVLLPVIDS